VRDVRCYHSTRSLTVPLLDDPSAAQRPIPPIGTRASVTRTIRDEDIRKFAEITGDSNPLHLDDDYAATTRFGGRIAHGMLTAGLISTIVGTKLPGLGAIYLQQQVRFVAPVRPGDTITATGEVIAVRPEKRILTLRTDCTNQHGVLVITGEAVVMC
jgi:3-hydroxybutyryl-CoA dehydratase